MSTDTSALDAINKICVCRHSAALFVIVSIGRNQYVKKFINCYFVYHAVVIYSSGYSVAPETLDHSIKLAVCVPISEKNKKYNDVNQNKKKLFF